MNYSGKKIWKCALVILLAFLMAFQGSATIFANTIKLDEAKELSLVAASNGYKTYYVSDVRIGSYTALTNAGYIVDEESATSVYFDEYAWYTSKNPLDRVHYLLNPDNSHGFTFCIGYKVSDKIEDAIYDISVLDMYGEYTELTYREYLIDRQKEMVAVANRVWDAAKLLAKKYNAGSTYAKLAVDTLNTMYISVERANGTQTRTYDVLLGNYMVGKSGISQSEQDYLDLVFLCSTSTIGFIYSQLALGVFDDLNQENATSWLNRLCEAGPFVMYDDDGSVITDDGILNAYYADEGVDFEYIDRATEIYNAAKDFIDNYLIALERTGRSAALGAMSKEDISTAQDVNQGRIGDREGNVIEATEDDQAKANLINDTMYIALFDALDEKTETVVAPDPEGLADYIGEDYETAEEYLADLATLINLEDSPLSITKEEYDEEAAYVNLLAYGSKTVEAVYPYGTNSDGTQRTLAQFLLEACTVDPDTLIYKNDLYRPFYTFIRESEDGILPMEPEQETMLFLTGFNNALLLGLTPTDVDATIAAVKEEMASLKKDLGVDSISVWYDVDATLIESYNLGTNVYWTSAAARVTAAQKRYDMLIHVNPDKETTALDRFKKAIDWMSLLSTVIGGVGGIMTILTGTFGSIAAIAPTVSGVAAAFFAGQVALFSSASVFFSVVGTVMTWVGNIALIVVLLMQLIDAIIDAINDSKPPVSLEYTTIPGLMYDYNDTVELEGVPIKYYPIQACGVESPDSTTNIFSYYRNVRQCPWVCLYYTKDPAAAPSPITVEYQWNYRTTIPFVSYIYGLFAETDTYSGHGAMEYYKYDTEADGWQWSSSTADTIIKYHAKGYSTLPVHLYSGSYIQNIESCELDSKITENPVRDYTPIHAFDDYAAYNFAYYGNDQWPATLNQRIHMLQTLSRVVKWYMHRPAHYYSDTGDGQYLKDIILRSDKNAEIAKNDIIQGGYILVDQNLTPTSKVYSYIGYKTTSDSAGAIVDLRWGYATGADYNKADSVVFGGSTYVSCGAIGNLTLFYSSSDKSTGLSAAGTPILINGPSSEEYPDGIRGKGLIISDHFIEGTGYEPVNLLCGGPAFDIDGGGEWITAYDSSGKLTITPKEYQTEWDSHMYLYFYPETTYIDGPEYLGGLAFFSGRDYNWDHQVLNYIEDAGWTRLSDIDVSGHTYIMYLNKTYLCYSTTHNPYRAIYGISYYRADSTADSMMYNISAGSAGGYCACDVFQQGGEGYFKYEERGLRMSHSYRTGSYWDGAVTDGYTKITIKDNKVTSVSHVHCEGYFREVYTLNDGFSVAYRQVTNVGLYVTGNQETDIEKASPILAGELVASDSPEYNSAKMTPVRSITDWYATEPVNLGYTEEYDSNVNYIFKDSYIDYDDVFDVIKSIENPDGTTLENNYDDDEWYEIDPKIVDNESFNLYKDEHLYLFIKRPSEARPVLVQSVKVAYAGDKENRENGGGTLEGIGNRAPIDEVIAELVANGPGQLVRINLTGNGCDNDKDYYASCLDISDVCAGGGSVGKGAPKYHLPYCRSHVGSHNDDREYCYNSPTKYYYPILSDYRSDEVAYIWVTYTNSTMQNLSDIRIYECDEEEYNNGLKKEMIVENGAKALKSGDSFKWNGKYYTLYSIYSLNNSITDFIVDKNVFTSDDWTVCSTDGKASSYTEYFFHLVQYKDFLAKRYVAIGSIVQSYASNERDAQIQLLNMGCRTIYPVNLKKGSGTSGAVYLGYRIVTTSKQAISNLVLQNNGQDKSVAKLKVGSSVYTRAVSNLNTNVYDTMVDLYATQDAAMAASTGSSAGRYLNSIIFWSDPDFWQLFTGTTEEAETKVREYLDKQSAADREYLEYYLYAQVGSKLKLLKYSPVTDVYGNIVNCNLSSANFASDSATDSAVYMFACYSDNIVVAPKSLVGSIFDEVSGWVIGSTVTVLAVAAVGVVLYKKRKRKEIETLSETIA